MVCRPAFLAIFDDDQVIVSALLEEVAARATPATIEAGYTALHRWPGRRQGTIERHPTGSMQRGMRWRLVVELPDPREYL